MNNNYEKYDVLTLIRMLESKDRTIINRNGRISELQKQVTQLKKECGLQEDGFTDTPSLNIILFDENGRPTCSEHGTMNCYDYKIYRCVMCGVAVSLNGKKVIKDDAS